MKALDSPDEVIVDLSRLCTTTWVLKGLRSKYCTQTGAVIDEFDHYCIWLNCAIGKNNHRPFICLALAECKEAVVDSHVAPPTLHANKKDGFENFTFAPKNGALE